MNRKANRSVVVSRLDNKSGSWLRIRNSNPASSPETDPPPTRRAKLPGALKRPQRLRLAAIPIQRHHQLRLQPLRNGYSAAKATNSPATT